MNKILKIKCYSRRKKKALRARLALKSALRKKYCIQVLHRKKSKTDAYLKLKKHMKEAKYEQFRIQWCDRRYALIDILNQFITQRLQVLEKCFQEETDRKGIES